MFLKPFTVVAALALVLLALQPLAAETSASEDQRIEKLERAVDQLQKRNAELEQEVSSLKKRSPFAPEFGPESKPKATSEGKGYVEKAEEKPKVYVVPGASEYKLTLGGYIQFNLEDGDVAASEGRFGLTALKDRFRLRRARINLTGDYTEHFDFKIEGDFEQSDTALTVKVTDPKTGKSATFTNSTRTDFSATDIYINWHDFPEANIKVGQYKAPYGLEQLTPDYKLLMIERSLPTNALTPERQVGVELWGKPLTNLWPQQKDLVTYYSGIFNGNGRNINTNDNNNFMYVGRLELQPFKGRLFGQEAFLKVGADFLESRDDAGTNITPAGGGNLKVNSDGSLSAYVLPGADERTAWSLDGWLNIGPFDLRGEYLTEDVNGRTVAGVPPGFTDFYATGWYVQGTYYLIPAKLQAAVRWDELDPGQLPNDGIHSITGGLNYYIHGDDLKLMANYIHTWSDYRAANPDLGQQQFNEVILRLQLMF